jgi:hypothetical protein
VGTGRAALKQLLVPARVELLVRRPASRMANRVKNERPALLEVEAPLPWTRSPKSG